MIYLNLETEPNIPQNHWHLDTVGQCDTYLVIGSCLMIHWCLHPGTTLTQSRLSICVPVEMNKALSLEMIKYICSYWKYHFKSQSSALWFVNKEKTVRGTFFTSFITGLAGEEGTLQSSHEEMFPISSFGHRICTKLTHHMFDFYKRNVQITFQWFINIFEGSYRRNYFVSNV